MLRHQSSFIPQEIRQNRHLDFMVGWQRVLVGISISEARKLLVYNYLPSASMLIAVIFFRRFLHQPFAFFLLVSREYRGRFHYATTLTKE